MSAARKIPPGLVYINTDQYRSAHLIEPHGRSGWAFDFGRGPEACPGLQTFTAAKQWARALAASRGVYSVAVCA